MGISFGKANDPKGRVLDQFLPGVPWVPATRTSFDFFFNGP